MDEFIGKEVDAFCPINFFDLKVIPTFYIKRDRVCTLIHDVCVYLIVKRLLRVVAILLLAIIIGIYKVNSPFYYD